MSEKFDLDPTWSVEEAIGRTMGFVSTCWENPGGAGEFQSTEAAYAAEQLIDYVKELIWEAGLND